MDYLVVGAGFFGAVIAERIATQLNKKVLIIDKRPHIGGNCYSEKDKTGIEYHKYGTHIFHTSSQEVWDYLSNFTELNSYYHQVLTTHKDKVFQMPINLETINSFYNVNLKPFEVDAFLAKEKAKETYPNPKNLEEKAISLIGRPLYEAFIKGYTKKQWNKDPVDLPASIINRLPVRSNYNETYFHNAKWQGIPKDGYTKIFERILDHPNIKVRLNTDYEDFTQRPKEKVIYTGPIDKLFDYKHGNLEWRSIRLEREELEHEDFQGTSVMNFADENIPYTRIHEPKHLHPERNYEPKNTVIFKEYPENNGEEFYPVKDEKNLEIYQKYVELAAQDSSLILGGRLATYQYYDMDQVIAQALNTFKKLSNG